MTTAKGRKLAFAAFVNGVHLRDGINTKRIGDDLGKLAEIVYLDGTASTKGEVEGNVIFNGKPVGMGKIFFHPGEGKSIELAIKEGKFKGEAPPGRFAVTIEFEGGPKKYQQRNASGLVLTVAAGENFFALELKD
jgi:hypothetical protein